MECVKGGSMQKRRSGVVERRREFSNCSEQNTKKAHRSLDRNEMNYRQPQELSYPFFHFYLFIFLQLVTWCTGKVIMFWRK